MKDLDPLKYFLGIKVARSSLGIYLCERKYALEIISKTGLMGAKSSYTPLEPNHQLAKANCPFFDSLDHYCLLIGKFIYLTLSRHELAFAVHILAQFMHAPGNAHWEAALRVVTILKDVLAVVFCFVLIPLYY